MLQICYLRITLNLRNSWVVETLTYETSTKTVRNCITHSKSLFSERLLNWEKQGKR